MLLRWPEVLEIAYGTDWLPQSMWPNEVWRHCHLSTKSSKVLIISNLTSPFIFRPHNHKKRKISSRHESEIGKQHDLIFNSSYWNETTDRESVKRIRIKWSGFRNFSKHQLSVYSCRPTLLSENIDNLMSFLLVRLPSMLSAMPSTMHAQNTSIQCVLIYTHAHSLLGLFELR